MKEETNIFKPNTAGFIKPDGSLIIADEDEESAHYGVLENNPELADENYPEFSNTHPEEDTCVRLYKEPTEKQYERLEEIIDTYLDFEEYCKVEIWNNGKYDFYEVYSLRDGVCQDTSWNEKVGNWTGYKLIQIIRNYFENHLNESVVPYSIIGYGTLSTRKDGAPDLGSAKERALKMLGDKFIRRVEITNDGKVVWTKQNLVNESSRSALISKSKGADKYANGKGSRWTQKSKCTVASTVKDYNKIDMNTFWKNDKLTFGVKVTGETNSYVVTISFDHILDKIQRKIHDNKNLLEFKCIYDALIQAINTGDVLVSCTCPDYKYRIKYWNSQNGDEAGTKETRAADITNPDDSKGPACKHILAVLNNVEWLNKVASVINNYANYCKDNMEYNYSKYIFPKLYGMDYKKAVQLVMDDYDENGELKDTLDSDESTINLSNALGKVRGRIQKGSNKNPAAKKKEESLQESLELNEDITEEPYLTDHFNFHCEASEEFGKDKTANHYDNYPFTKEEVANKEEYKEFAKWFVKQLSGDLPFPSTKNKIKFTDRVTRIEVESQSNKNAKTKDVLIYCKIDEPDLYLYATYFSTQDEHLNYKSAIRTFYKVKESVLKSKIQWYKDLKTKREQERKNKQRKH